MGESDCRGWCQRVGEGGRGVREVGREGRRGLVERLV